MHPNQITQREAELMQGAPEVFATAAEKRHIGPDLKTLHTKFGAVTLEDDFLSVASAIRAQSDDRCDTPDVRARQLRDEQQSCG